MRRQPFRSVVRRPSSDDWFPNFPDGTVEVSMIELSTGEWRVCVWGNDDCGMERDYPAGDRVSAEQLFDRLVGCSDVTKQFCRGTGMQFV